MPKLRPLRKPEDIAAVPADRPVAIDLSEENTPIDTTPEVEKVEPVEAKAPPAPELEPEEESPLQKQLKEMERGQEALRRQLAAERTRAEAEIARERGGREEAEYDSIVTALGSAQAEADRAQNDFEIAAASGDIKAQGEAQRRMATAAVRLDRFEEAKANIEARREQAKAQPAARPADPIDALTHLSARQRDWLKAHPETMNDARKNRRLQDAHDDAIEEGHAQDSDGYYQFIEQQLGYRRAPQQQEIEPEPTRRSHPVSAPVSRDSPSMSTGRPQRRTVELSPEQREAAKISGVDELTYAKGVLELERRKKLGMYPDRA